MSLIKAIRNNLEQVSTYTIMRSFWHMEEIKALNRITDYQAKLCMNVKENKHDMCFSKCIRENYTTHL